MTGPRDDGERLAREYLVASATDDVLSLRGLLLLRDELYDDPVLRAAIVDEKHRIAVAAIRELATILGIDAAAVVDMLADPE
jgi:hypothetical protein